MPEPHILLGVLGEGEQPLIVRAAPDSAHRAQDRFLYGARVALGVESAQESGVFLAGGRVGVAGHTLAREGPALPVHADARQLQNGLGAHPVGQVRFFDVTAQHAFGLRPSACSQRREHRLARPLVVALVEELLQRLRRRGPR